MLTRTWRDATEAASLTCFHFHDLRHTGNTIAATTGASLRELMERMGHSTTRAALIYQHRSTERDRLIADAMSKLAETELRQGKKRQARSGHASAERRHEPGCLEADQAADLLLCAGAGDENRTRTISLGS